MRCSVGRRGTKGVVAAMARANRMVAVHDITKDVPTTATTTEMASPSTSSVAGVVSSRPRYLVRDVELYARQMGDGASWADSPPAVRPSGLATGFSTRTPALPLSAFIAAAKASYEDSLSSFVGHWMNSLEKTEQTPVSQGNHREATERCALVRGAGKRIGDTSSSKKAWEDDENDIDAAIKGYNPTLARALVQRVAARVAIADTLQMARQLLRYLRDASKIPEGESERPADGDASSTNTAKMVLLLRHAAVLCREHYMGRSSAASATAPVLSPGIWALTAAARESAGIVTRFRTAANSSSASQQQQRRSRRTPPRCFLGNFSDVQISEVLPHGKVVSFTHATLPEDVGKRTEGAHGPTTSEAEDSARPPKQTSRHRGPPVSFCGSLESCLRVHPEEVYFYCVLYRHGVSLAAAIANIVEASEGLVSPADVSVNLHNAENDEHVVVQTCRVRVAVPKTASPSTSIADDHIQHCLNVARAIVQINLAMEVPCVAIQLLECRLNLSEDNTRCSESVVAFPAQLQYALLLRGFEHRGGPTNQLEHLAHTCARCIPNYFPPQHFGGAAVPFFRTYHVTEALSKGRYAEAAVMLLCLELVTAVADTTPSVAPWCVRALQLICDGEWREGVWQSWWMHEVPPPLQQRIAVAKAELVWNVVASCRLHELARTTGGRSDLLLVVTPELGDFVQQRSEESEKVGQDASAVPVTFVRPVCSDAQAAGCNIHDIVLPVVPNTGSVPTECESLVKVQALLGFTSSRQRSSTLPFLTTVHAASNPARASGTITFRPLLIEATGYPRTGRPWCRSFQQPLSTATVGKHRTDTVADGTPVFALATDWELTASAVAARDYAAKSRGHRGQVWPLSKRGRAITDRLPVGLLAVSSATGSSLPGGASPSHRYTLRCLAVHCTLPATVSLGNYIAELATLEDRRSHGGREREMQRK